MTSYISTFQNESFTHLGLKKTKTVFGLTRKYSVQKLTGFYSIKTSSMWKAQGKFDFSIHDPFKLSVSAYQILEPRFYSETLAMLLNIPPQKTLLRRHLTTNFSTLVGLQAQQEKQEFANASGHTPLNTTAKVRVWYYTII